MKVLIADDDPVSRRVLEAALIKLGYEVTACRDGAAAWKALQETDAPKLAILDWLMPPPDGLEICRRIRCLANEKSTYVILLTANADMGSLVAGLDSGADDYITKPFDARELRARLRTGQRIVALQETLRVEATHDALTGAWNRKGIFDLLERELHRAERTGSSVGVILGDLDHFKRVNDTYGHLAGDDVLRETVRRITALLRHPDALGRFGGEEFLVVLPDCAAGMAMKVAQRIRRAIAGRHAETTAGLISFTISLGTAATGTVATPDPAALLQVADRALYRAKRKGRNRVGNTNEKSVT
jgi:two-component system cell cycle response regulator